MIRGSASSPAEMVMWASVLGTLLELWSRDWSLRCAAGGRAAGGCWSARRRMSRWTRRCGCSCGGRSSSISSCTGSSAGDHAAPRCRRPPWRQWAAAAAAATSPAARLQRPPAQQQPAPPEAAPSDEGPRTEALAAPLALRRLFKLLAGAQQQPQLPFQLNGRRPAGVGPESPGTLASPPGRVAGPELPS